MAGIGIQVESGENNMSSMRSVGEKGEKGHVGIFMGVSLVVEYQAWGDVSL